MISNFKKIQVIQGFCLYLKEKIQQYHKEYKKFHNEGTDRKQKEFITGRGQGNLNGVDAIGTESEFYRKEVNLNRS